MFVGHLAVALAAKKVEPAVPLSAAVAAAFGVDLLWPVLLLLGVEVVRVNPGDTAFTHLAFESYPWSHSLAMVVAWSGLVVAISRRFLASRGAAWLLGGLVLSHWLLDLATHRPDLPLYPGGPVSGFGLWNSIAATVVVEGSLLVACTWVYLRSTSASDGVGRWALVGLLTLTGAIWLTQPWSPPPPSETAVAWTALALWILPPWARWVERHRGVRARAASS